MILDIVELKSAMVARKLNNETFAEKLKMSEPTFYRKIKEPEKFTVAEVLDIVSVLKLDAKEKAHIFPDLYH